MHSSSYQRFFAAYLKMCHFRTQIMFAHGSRGNGPVSGRKSLVLEGFLRIDYSRVIRDFGGSPYERNSKRRPVAATGRRLEFRSYGEPPKSRMIDWQKTSCAKTGGAVIDFDCVLRSCCTWDGPLGALKVLPRVGPEVVKSRSRS